MKKLPFVIFLFIMATAISASISSYRRTQNWINRDVNNALAQTLAEMPSNVVSADTIRCYRHYLSIPELKDTACIAMRTVRRDGRHETELVAEANCGFMTVFMLSDQRPSGALLLLAAVWMMGTLWYTRRHRQELQVLGVNYGGVTYTKGEFLTTEGERIRLTPMQHSLMEMFMETEDHTLSKQEICDRLWPKKPDASDTLYTLIRRIKPIIEANSNLKIESDRGKSYKLELK